MPGPSRVSLCWQPFGLPKRGHSAEEYEDAFAADPRTGRFAVADGASESSFAALWAQLLVNGFVYADRPPSPLTPTPRPRSGDEGRVILPPLSPRGERGARGEGMDWLAALRQHWAAKVDAQPLPWYAEAKRQQGAFATLLGLVVRRCRGQHVGRWRAWAVGDSCLFQVRGDHLIRAFPVLRSRDFDGYPDLLGSRPSANDRLIAERQRYDRGRWQPDDRFFLMTDALAVWFLREYEAGRRPWRPITDVLNPPSPAAGFASWVAQLRQREELRNDDVTLISLSFVIRH